MKNLLMFTLILASSSAIADEKTTCSIVGHFRFGWTESMAFEVKSFDECLATTRDMIGKAVSISGKPITKADFYYTDEGEFEIRGTVNKK